MHGNELKLKITSVENVRKMRKIYLYDRQSLGGDRWALWGGLGGDEPRNIYTFGSTTQPVGLFHYG